MSRNFPQKAVLWANNGLDDFGEPKVDAAIEIDVRWEETNSQSSNPHMSSESSPITVYIDREVTIGSVMWLGKLFDLPDTLSNLKQVVDTQTIPDIKGRHFERVLKLDKLGDSLPTLA